MSKVGPDSCFPDKFKFRTYYFRVFVTFDNGCINCQNKEECTRKAHQRRKIMFSYKSPSKLTHAFVKVRFSEEIILAISQFPKIDNAWITCRREAGYAREVHHGTGVANDDFFKISVENDSHIRKSPTRPPRGVGGLSGTPHKPPIQGWPTLDTNFTGIFSDYRGA